MTEREVTSYWSRDRAALLACESKRKAGAAAVSALEARHENQ